MATFTVGQVLTAAEMNAIAGDTGWIGATLLNSYTGSTVVAYRRIGNRLHLRGLLTTGASNFPAFTLPSGYFRPAGCNLPTASALAGNTATAAWLQIDTSGNCIPEFSTSTSGVFTLDGLSFLLD